MGCFCPATAGKGLFQSYSHGNPGSFRSGHFSLGGCFGPISEVGHFDSTSVHFFFFLCIYTLLINNNFF